MERSDVDILAARKRAAERAKAVKPSEPAPAEPAPPAAQAEPEPATSEAAEPEATAFPPLPDTEYLPDEPVAGPELRSPEQNKALSAETPDAPEPETVRSPEPTTATAAAVVPVENAEEEVPEEQPLEMLAFLLGSEEYVVPVDQVREILTPKEITPVPHTAEYLLGVCSLRGTVMPVIDLNRRLGLAASERDERSRIVVVSLGPDDQVGLFTDRVRGVVRFLPSAVRPAPETVAQGAGAEFLKGIARKDDRLYILLDAEKAVGT